MANTYGKAGHGAMIQAIESATQRLATQPASKTPTRTQSSTKQLGATRKILLAIFGFFVFVGLISTEWVFVGFSLIVAFLIWATTPTSITRAPTKQNTLVNKEISADMHKAYHALRNGGDIKESPFQGDEIAWALGGLAEERTAKKLAHGLGNTYTIINDIALIDRNTVTANIDHLVLTNKGTIMVDTKVWAKPLLFTQKDSNTWLEKHTDPPAWSSVSTCLYEASFLPEAPKAIVFAVGGKAGRDLEKYSSPVRITHYYERFDDAGNLQPCAPTTVLFVAQSRIVDTIKELDTLPGTTTFSIADYLALENLNF